jgi:hypothetical protein
MKTRILFLTIAIIIGISGFVQKAEAQKVKPLKFSGTPIPIIKLHIFPLPTTPPFTTTGKIVLNCNTPIPADSSGCGSFDASGTDSVSYSIGTSVDNLDGMIFISNNLILTNKTSCNENFVVCQMVEYDAPYKDQHIPDSVYGGQSFGEAENQWTLTQHVCGTCPTGCDWTCSDDTTGFQNYWTYYFGCEDVNLAPGQSKAIFPGAHLLAGPVLGYQITDGHIDSTKPITLSQKPHNGNDTSATTWNYDGSYFDILKGCSFLPTSGCDFENEPNQQLTETPLGSGCINPAWSGYTQIASHGGSYPTGIISFPIGNQETTTLTDTNNWHTVYQAEFVGYLVGAPAGSELTVYAPEDTSSGDCVIDSGKVWTDTVGACQSDTLKFEFPFLIPPNYYLDRGMTFKLQLPPDSCSNIGNGAKVYLNGTVFANATTPLYDSGAFMYNTIGTMVLDTTPPAVTSFVATPLDSTRLAISMTGSDIASKVIFGGVTYTINSGPLHAMALRYADSVAVGDTTTFIDTLVSPVSHPMISIKGFVGNELGILDSTITTSYPLRAAPQGIGTQTEDSLRVNYLLIDHQSKILTLDVQADGASIELDLVTEDGRSTKLTYEGSSPNGEQQFIQSFANFANGAYFLVIKSGGNSIVENIVL